MRSANNKSRNCRRRLRPSCRTCTTGKRIRRLISFYGAMIGVFNATIQTIERAEELRRQNAVELEESRTLKRSLDEMGAQLGERKRRETR